MQRETVRALYKGIPLAVLSAALLVLSFPEADVGFLAWIGLAPLFAAIDRKGPGHAFLLSYFSGMLFFVGVFRWILVVPGYTMLHHALLALYLGVYFGFFGLAVAFISKCLGSLPAMVAAPFIWTALEFMRSNFFFLALPWGLLAHTQYRYPAIIQIAAVAGTYSISFLIVLCNASAAAILLGARNNVLPCVQKKGVTVFHSQPNRLVAAAILIFAAATFYGTLAIPDRVEGNRIKISLIQGNVEQFKKWDPNFAREIRNIYLGLTEEVAKDRPELIVWPETATPGSITTDPEFYRQIKNELQRTGIPLLLGSAHNQKLIGSKQRDRDAYNSAFLLGTPSPKSIQRYDKMLLFPFGEFTPYKEIIPWSGIGVPVRDHFVPGKEHKIFQHPEFRFGVTICWENVFSHFVREMVRYGAECIVNLTNEAHFGRTAASHQLLAISVFRAVENRVFVIRCANTGVSCIIGPYGRIVDRVTDEEGRSTFVRGTLTGWIVPMRSKTLFTEYGNVLVWVSLLGSFGFLITAVFKRRGRSRG